MATRASVLKKRRDVAGYIVCLKHADSRLFGGGMLDFPIKAGERFNRAVRISSIAAKLQGLIR